MPEAVVFTHASMVRDELPKGNPSELSCTRSFTPSKFKAFPGLAQLSPAVGDVRIVVPEHKPGVLFMVTPGAQVMDGGVISSMITVCVCVEVLPFPSS